MDPADHPPPEHPGVRSHARRGAARRVLEPSYYLDNFSAVLSTVRSRYADLLAPDELRLVTDFPGLPRNARCLLARLVMREKFLFRASRLNYAEIGDTGQAAVPLMETGWLTDRPMLTLEQLQGILTKPELIRCLRLPSRYSTWRKATLVAMLKARFERPRRLADWWPAEPEVVYALLVAPVCERIRLMFFGNHRQGWSEFVTADLGIFKYERTERTLHTRPFQTRAQIAVFQRLHECRELFEQGMPLRDLMRILPEAIDDSDWIEDRRQSLLFSIAREFERTGDADAALTLYSNCGHRGSRTRAIRLKARARDWEATRALCLQAQLKPESEAELQYLRRVLPRVNRRLGIADAVADAAPPIPQFEVALPRAARAVEYDVLDHLVRDLPDGTTVRYVENGLINALFGLLCWPAIFAPVPGAFFHDFHRAPADLASAHFHRRRQGYFAECLSHLKSGRHRHAIWRTFEQKRGVQSPFVRWEALDKTLLRWALDCFPAAHLELWFQWILRDVEENRSGFPDLVQFWPDERRYRMIEVKGPGDRLQDNQRRFLEFCVAHGMPVSVCHVRQGAVRAHSIYTVRDETTRDGSAGADLRQTDLHS
jgi:hypothetical protein